MTKPIAVLCSCLALGIVAAGCGGDDEEGGGGGAQQQDTAAGGGGKRVEVSMEGNKFVPASVTVAKGGTVVWTNNDSVGHDVTKRGGVGASFKSGDPGGLKTDDTFQQRFDAAGDVKYVCTVHPGMEGSITVE
jgi:plastocyanin